jgi:hypothetical protein
LKTGGRFDSRNGSGGRGRGEGVAEVGVVMVVAAVEDGLITLAAVEVDGAQVAVAVLVEAGMLDGVERAVTATVVLVAVEVAGEQLLLVVEVEVAGEGLLLMLTQVVEAEVAGEQLLEAPMTTQDGAATKRWSQHGTGEAVGGLVAVDDGFVVRPTANIKLITS